MPWGILLLKPDQLIMLCIHLQGIWISSLGLDLAYCHFLLLQGSHTDCEIVPTTHVMKFKLEMRMLHANNAHAGQSRSLTAAFAAGMCTCRSNWKL